MWNSARTVTNDPYPGADVSSSFTCPQLQQFQTLGKVSSMTYLPAGNDTKSVSKALRSLYFIFYNKSTALPLFFQIIGGFIWKKSKWIFFGISIFR